MIGDTLYQGFLQSFFQRQVRGTGGSIFRCFRRLPPSFPRLHQAVGEFYQSLGSTLLTIQDHVLNHVELLLGNICISHLRGRVHNTKVHPLLDGVVEEHSMHGLTNIVVASERKAQVTHTTTDVGPRQIVVDPSSSTDKVGCIGIMLLHTRSHSQHVGVEDDIQRIHAHLLRQQPIGSFCNLYTALVTRGLTFFVEAHHHHSSAIALHVARMFQELLLTLFQRDRVHDALTLHALQSCTNHLPIRGVDHHRHPGDIGLCSNHIQEVGHLGLGVEQTVVHVDIYHEGTIGHLFSGNTNGLVVALLLNQSQELPRTSDVTPFSDIHKLHLGRHLQQFQS